jgi:hypothetical protein
MMAGYSGTPLVKKLGMKEGHVVVIVGEPPELRQLLGELPPGVELRAGTGGEPADLVMLFTTERATLAAELPAAAEAIFPAGAIWVAWPKKASKVPTDITEDTVREVALPARLVDNKVCAISDVWSGLRVVWRKEHRN